MIDHVSPAKDSDTAIQGRIMRTFAKKHDIRMFDIGENGVCHALIPEYGLVLPGDVGIMGDSHTCTHGAFCTLSFGVGTTDLESGLITGNVAIGKQEVIRVNFVGKLSKNVFSKDMILQLLATIKTNGATNAILEFGGNVIDEMNMEQRMTITNMSVEAGATSGMMMVDENTINYLWPIISENYDDKESALLDLSRFNSDDDCEYAKTVTIDVTDMQPMITDGYSPDEGINVSNLRGKKVDQVYIGSCTNGRIEDFRIVAHIFQQTGAMVCDGVRCIITPTTQRVQQQMVEEGIFKILSEANCYMSGPTCGACLGMSNGVLAPDEVCVSTTNRNFPGRMGKNAMVHLASPAVAAITAIMGYIDVPGEELLDSLYQDWAFDNVAKPVELVYKSFDEIDYKSLVSNDGGSKLTFGGMIFHLPKENVDTDQIIPARYLTKVELSVFGEHCLEDAGLTDSQKAQLGPAGVLISGKNFGCGSSREHAVYAFRESGINTVIAPSFARIFETSMFNNGMLCITMSQEDIDKIIDKCFVDVLDIDVNKGIISTKHTKEEIVSFSLTNQQKKLIDAGGSMGMMIELAAKLNSKEED
ncbi:MAG: aconitase/3-isopropylmalate dehydratase large subunit family protein [Candidatus Moraniibacteriota bacterium]|jgi:3-isopropylmalate/(R)-2-methylmalate dehydratase large subunit